ncbi:hypothetical protein [uncultured Thiodictyon sp.]|uniref:hypothetical protein n=1 Tax=uncultured Thiodictyon sp. TaxID=1846217 RepID=UPI0025F52D9D|nr:hypothetical protein [uncultured Thiodictyon sp.]
MPWRPRLAEFTATLTHPAPWTISLAAFGRGIDNARIDCLLSPRLRALATDSVRQLIRADAASPPHRSVRPLIGATDLAALRDAYLDLFDAALYRHPEQPPGAVALLLHFTLLKYLLQLLATETRTVPPPYEAQDIRRRVGQHLVRTIRKLASTRLSTLRTAALGPGWPITEPLLFNPLLLIPDPGEALAADYPMGWLAGAALGDWLAQTARDLTQTFAPWLPEWLTGDQGTAPPIADTQDQGQRDGQLVTAALLERFVPRAEYRRGLTSWLDEPGNLRLLLNPGAPRAAGAHRQHPRWAAFQHDLLEQLAAGLQAQGRRRVIEIVYALPGLHRQLGQTLPLPLVLDYVDGRLPRRALEPELAALAGGPERVLETLERLRAERQRQTPAAALALIGHYLVDFLRLRRDLKLAYKTFETLDAIHLLEDANEVRLSRSNASLNEFLCADEGGGDAHAPRRIRAHTVLKADVRGSTLITEELRARGLNPASHFSLNFFDPVNRLLAEFAAEKLFVEGDAVILALYEYADDREDRAVARACQLARKILQVIDQQNVQNRALGLPELELGLGISFARREPNFLYDEGRPIMISSAINQADRLSSCSGLLLRSGFLPAHSAFRVAVVRDAVIGERAGPGRDLLNYNVNGVKLDESAFLKLQEELPLRALRLPDPEAAECLFFSGTYTDADGLTHWIDLRHAPVRDWNGDTVGPVEPDRRHYFELIVDESLAERARQLATAGVAAPASL